MSGFPEKDGTEVGQQTQFILISTSSRKPGGLQGNEDSFRLEQTSQTPH